MKFRHSFHEGREVQRFAIDEATPHLIVVCLITWQECVAWNNLDALWQFFVIIHIPYMIEFASVVDDVFV